MRHDPPAPRLAPFLPERRPVPPKDLRRLVEVAVVREVVNDDPIPRRLDRRDHVPEDRRRRIEPMNQADRRPRRIVGPIRLECMHAIIGPTFSLGLDPVEEPVEPLRPIIPRPGTEPPRRNPDREFSPLDDDSQVGPDRLREQAPRDRPPQPGHRQLERHLRRPDLDPNRFRHRPDEFPDPDLEPIIERHPDRRPRLPPDDHHPDRDRPSSRHRHALPAPRSLSPSPTIIPEKAGGSNEPRNLTSDNGRYVSLTARGLVRLFWRMPWVFRQRCAEFCCSRQGIDAKI